jgi:hypothetical protein
MPRTTKAQSGNDRIVTEARRYPQKPPLVGTELWLALSSKPVPDPTSNLPDLAASEADRLSHLCEDRVRRAAVFLLRPNPAPNPGEELYFNHWRTEAVPLIAEFLAEPLIYTQLAQLSYKINALGIGDLFEWGNVTYSNGHQAGTDIGWAIAVGVPDSVSWSRLERDDPTTLTDAEYRQIYPFVMRIFSQMAPLNLNALLARIQRERAALAAALRRDDVSPETNQTRAAPVSDPGAGDSLPDGPGDDGFFVFGGRTYSIGPRMWSLTPLPIVGAAAKWPAAGRGMFTPCPVR